VRTLATAAQRFREGDRALRSGIRRGDEIGFLSTAFDDMANEVEGVLAGLEEQVASRTRDLEEQRASLERALEDLKASTAARLALSETVRQLSTPVIKLYENVLVMPIIGSIDRERAEQIESSLLAGIEAHAAEEVLLDLTGVAIVDTQVAACLLRAARSAELLGASVTLVGITGRVAQSIIHLGVDLSGVQTRGDLQSGLIHALRKIGRGVRAARRG
jgi:rsbT co-antagonist protein RsbR